jgi:tRNA-specific 2-thiouridylase
VQNSTKTVVVGVSGGVDSSVSAALLQQAGYNVKAVFMSNWDERDENDQCTNEQDRKDAVQVCEHLGIPFHTVDFATEYWERVFEQTLSGFQSGSTPNPDVMCNRYIKFDCFRRYAIEEMGADVFATGHYALLKNAAESTTDAIEVGTQTYQIPSYEDVDSANLLYTPVDQHKDQTYFLAMVQHGAFAQSMFPLALLTKPQVREIAAELQLPTATKRDSVGICFIGKRKFSEFISEYVEQTPGQFMHIDTRHPVPNATHIGMSSYTLGQNARISGQKHKMYVCGKDMERNEIWVCDSASHPALRTEQVSVAQVS